MPADSHLSTSSGHMSKLMSTQRSSEVLQTVDTISVAGMQGSGSASLISLGDSSAPEDSDFVASDSEEDENDDQDTPEPARRPYQTHVKNRALQGDVEIIEEECKELQYQGGVLCFARETRRMKASCTSSPPAATLPMLTVPGRHTGQRYTQKGLCR